jgi:hypothetical protein
VAWPATNVVNVTVRSTFSGSPDHVQITLAAVLLLLAVVSKIGVVTEDGSVA